MVGDLEEENTHSINTASKTSQFPAFALVGERNHCLYSCDAGYTLTVSSPVSLGRNRN